MHKNGSILVPFLLSVLLLPLSSCMHAVMMGGHENDMKSDASVEKRITENNVDITALITPFTPNETHTVTINVNRAETKQPISGVDVSYHWMSMSMKDAGHHHDMGKMADTGMISGKARESAPGKYSFEISNIAEGHYSLSVTIVADSAAKPISFDVERNVPMQHNMGMMGMEASSTTPWIVTGALMATIMVVMWAVRGGI